MLWNFFLNFYFYLSIWRTNLHHSLWFKLFDVSAITFLIRKLVTLIMISINIRVLAEGQRTACWVFLSQKFHSTIHCFRDFEDNARVGWITIFISSNEGQRLFPASPRCYWDSLPAVRGIGVPSLHRIIFYNTATSRHRTMRTINTR